MLVCIASPMGLSRSAGALPEAEGFAVATTSRDQLHPDVNGGVAVWEDRRDGNSDVYGRSVPDGEEFQISGAPGDQREPKIDGNLVVWEDRRDGNPDVYGYDLSTRQEFRITESPSDERKPDVYGNLVVWEDNRNGDWDVYGYDLSTRQEREIAATSPGNKRNVAISGHTVVWQDDRRGIGHSDVYAKNLSNGEEFSVSTDPSFKDQPAISGSTVVWRQEGPNNYDIFGRDLAAGEAFQVTTNTADQYSPVVSGHLVVWVDGRNGNADIYAKDLSTGREFPVSTGAGSQETPAVDGETILWEDQRASDPNYGTWDVRGSTVDLAPAAPPGATAAGRLGGVDLRWTANGESDLAGYNLYRAASPDGAYEKLNPDALISATSYADATAPKRAVSHYRITAVDKAGNESAPAVAHGTSFAVPELSLAPNVSVTNYVGSVILSGRLTSNGTPIADEQVILEQKPVGAGSFGPVPGGSLTTRADGTFSLSNVKLAQNTEYRARFAGRPGAALAPYASASKMVSVRAVVTLSTSATVLRSGQAVTLSGAVAPKHAGTIKLTIKRNGASIATRYASLNSGLYRLAYTPPAAGSYSVVASFGGDADHAGGTSAARGFGVS
ncbi:Ig-like domain repeat protein [Rubrobacter marinus]|nr:Ig-like domain repeat protein [Rubrobacter marinus]